MNNKHLLKLLKHGAYVVVKREDSRFIIITPFIDSDGDQRTSFIEDNIEECKRNLFRSYFPQQYLEEKSHNWTLIEAYYPTFKPFEVGQRVKVIKIGYEGHVGGTSSTKPLKYWVNNDWYHHTELLPLEEETPITLSECSSDELLQEVKRRGLSEPKEVLKL